MWSVALIAHIFIVLLGGFTYRLTKLNGTNVVKKYWNGWQKLSSVFHCAWQVFVENSYAEFSEIQLTQLCLVTGTRPQTEGKLEVHMDGCGLQIIFQRYVIKNA
jgi:hypothetical protein